MLTKAVGKDLARVRADIFMQEIPLRILHAATDPSGLGGELVDSLRGQARTEDAIEALLLQGKTADALELAADLTNADLLFCCVMRELTRLIETEGSRKPLTKREERTLKSHVTLVLQQQRDTADPRLGIVMAAFGRQQRDIALLREAAALLEAENHLVAYAECMTSIVLLQTKLSSFSTSPPFIKSGDLASDVLALLEPLVELARILTASVGLSNAQLNADDLETLETLLFFMGLAYSERDDAFVAHPVHIRSTIFADVPDLASVTEDLNSLVAPRTGMVPAAPLLQHLLERTFVAARYWFCCLAAADSKLGAKEGSYQLLSTLSIGKATASLAAVFESCNLAAEPSAEHSLSSRLSSEIWRTPFGSAQVSLESIVGSSTGKEAAARKLAKTLFPEDTLETPANQRELLEKMPRGVADLMAANAVAAFASAPSLREALRAFRALVATDCERKHWADLVDALAKQRDSAPARTLHAGCLSFPPAALLPMTQALREAGDWRAAAELDARLLRDTGAVEVLERQVLWTLLHASNRHGPGSDSLFWTRLLFELHCSVAADPTQALAKSWAERENMDSESQVDALHLLHAACRDLSAINGTLRDHLLERKEGEKKALLAAIHRSATLAAVLMFNHLAHAAFPLSFALSCLLGCLGDVADLAEFAGDQNAAAFLRALKGAHARTPLAPLLQQFTACLKAARADDTPVLLSLDKAKASVHASALPTARHVSLALPAIVEAWQEHAVRPPAEDYESKALRAVLAAAEKPGDVFGA